MVCKTEASTKKVTPERYTAPVLLRVVCVSLPACLPLCDLKLRKHAWAPRRWKPISSMTSSSALHSEHCNAYASNSVAAHPPPSSPTFQVKIAQQPHHKHHIAQNVQTLELDDSGGGQ